MIDIMGYLTAIMAYKYPLVACIMLTLAVKDKLPFTKYARSGTDINIMTVFFEGRHFGRIQIFTPATLSVEFCLFDSFIS